MHLLEYVSCIILNWVSLFLSHHPFISADDRLTRLQAELDNQRVPPPFIDGLTYHICQIADSVRAHLTNCTLGIFIMLNMSYVFS